MKNNNSLVITLSAPSGTGKGAICARLLEIDDKITFFPTATNREKREGELHGVNYYFLTEKQFHEYIEQGELLEWSHHHSNYYGTIKKVIEEKLNKGLDVTSDLTWDGVRALKETWPTRTIKFLFMPPSVEELERRLTARQLVTNENPEKMQERLVKGVEDATHWQKQGYSFTSPDLIGSTINDYDYVIINEDLEKTVQQVHSIIQQERKKREKLGKLEK